MEDEQVQETAVGATAPASEAVAVEGRAKRERKQVSFRFMGLADILSGTQTAAFVVENIVKEGKEVEIPNGPGVTLGSIVAGTFSNYTTICSLTVWLVVEEAITKRKGDDDVLRSLHIICFGSQGQKLNRKKNLRQFCGFDSSTDKLSLEAKIIENKKKWTVALLKETLEILGIERSGSREELIRRLVDFLAFPEEKASRGRASTSKAKVFYDLFHLWISSANILGNEEKAICF